MSILISRNNQLRKLSRDFSEHYAVHITQLVMQLLVVHIVMKATTESKDITSRSMALAYCTSLCLQNNALWHTFLYHDGLKQ